MSDKVRAFASADLSMQVAEYEADDGATVRSRLSAFGESHSPNASSVLRQIASVSLRSSDFDIRRELSGWTTTQRSVGKRILG